MACTPLKVGAQIALEEWTTTQTTCWAFRPAIPRDRHKRSVFRSTAVYLFAQDSWKIRPSLTLNYGLRWELTTPLTDVGQKVQTFRPGEETKIYPCQLNPSNPWVATFGTTDCSPGSGRIRQPARVSSSRRPWYSC